MTTNRILADDESEAVALEVKSMREKMALSSSLIDKLREDADGFLNVAKLHSDRNQRISRRIELEQVLYREVCALTFKYCHLIRDVSLSSLY